MAGFFVFCILADKDDWMKKIEHLGIAVKDLAAGEAIFEKLLGTPSYKREEVVSEGVITSFFRSGPNKLELIQATDDEGALARFIDSRGEGLHHVAFDVEDIYREMDRLQSLGFQIIGDGPKQGADNKLVVFIHPKSSCGVLIELCQEIE